MPRIEEKFKVTHEDLFYNPYYIIRRNLYLSVQKYAAQMTGSLMDFGCGTRPYESLFTGISRYVGVDFEGGGNDYQKNRVDVFYDGKKLPFEDASFDHVLSTEVVEHIFNPDEIMSEINRVLRPGGTFLLTCPFLWPEHEQPWDYARYSSFGIRHLLERHGFIVTEQEKTGNFISSIIQLIVLYIYMFIPKIPVVRHALFFILCVPFHLIGAMLQVILPSRMKRKDLYLNNVVLAQKQGQIRTDKFQYDHEG